MENTLQNDNIITLYSPEEVADILQLGLTSTYQLLRTGKIKAFRIGKSWKVSKLALQEYILTESNLK